MTTPTNRLISSPYGIPTDSIPTECEFGDPVRCKEAPRWAEIGSWKGMCSRHYTRRRQSENYWVKTTMPLNRPGLREFRTFEPESGRCYVYVADAPEVGAIKVGNSLDPESRLRTIRRGDSTLRPDAPSGVLQVRLLLVAPAKWLDHEQVLHGKLSQWHICGEWFTDCPDAWRVIHAYLEVAVPS